MLMIYVIDNTNIIETFDQVTTLGIWREGGATQQRLETRFIARKN